MSYAKGRARHLAHMHEEHVEAVEDLKEAIEQALRRLTARRDRGAPIRFVTRRSFFSSSEKRFWPLDRFTDKPTKASTGWAISEDGELYDSTANFGRSPVEMHDLDPRLLRELIDKVNHLAP